MVQLVPDDQDAPESVILRSQAIQEECNGDQIVRLNKASTQGTEKPKRRIRQIMVENPPCLGL